MTEDYIPSTEEHEHEKAFNITKAVDKNSLLAIRLRERVCDDRNIDDGTARLFVRLLDLSLNPRFHFGSPGQVAIGQTKLATFLGVSTRTIRDRVNALALANYIWISHVTSPNMKPMNCYHIWAYQSPPETRETLPGAGLFGNGKRRFDAGFDRFEKRGKEAAGRLTGENLPVRSSLVDVRGNPISSFLPNNSPVSGEISPLTAEESRRCQRKNLASDSGEISPLRPEDSRLSQRQDFAADSGRISPQSTAADCRHIETQKEVERGFMSRRGGGEGGTGSPPPPKAALGEWGNNGFEQWKAFVQGEHSWKWTKMEKELETQLENAQGRPRKSAIRERIRYIRDLRLGGLPPDEEAPPTAPGKAKARVEISEEQLLKDALAMMESAAEAGLKPLLSPKHRAALARAGVAV